MTDTQVKWFHSNMLGAPVLRGEAGALIELLDACLINGFSPRTPDSITVASGVATVALSTGNPYEKHAVIKITGASVAALNDEWRISAAAASSLTFLCPGVPDGAVTGASIIRAGAGWEKPFTDTQKAVYRSLHPLASGVCLRIDDTDARYPRVRGYEDMTGINTGTNPFPTFAQRSADTYLWGKSDVATTSPRRWSLIGDGLFMWFLPDWSSNTPSPAPLHRFGDFLPYDASTLYPVLISGYTAAFSTSPWVSGHGAVPDDTASVYAPRDYVSNAYAPSNRANHTAWRGWRDVASPPAQSPAYPAYVVNGSTNISSAAGQSPGVFWVPDRRLDWAKRSVFEAGDRAFLRVEVIGISTGSGNFVLFDIKGPWQ